jgi:uncharacterized membrane protein YjjP (DUF1212 family)/uncharacterized membrane protein YjjB (DUF3815 family)
MQAKPLPTGAGELLEFMFRLGQAYLASGEQTALVERYLERVAVANGVGRARVVAFSTALFITVHDGGEERVTLAAAPALRLRLDQIADVYVLGEAAQLGELKPHEGLERLAELLQAAPRFGLAVVVVGHTILSVGMALVLMPALPNLAAAAVLGLVVGAVKAFNRDRPVLAAPLSVIAAALVSVLVFLGVKQGLPLDPQYALVAPLVTFLPGAMLTFGMVELAYGDMVSGSSRLVTGFVQLVLLVFGLTVGAALVGYRPENLVDAAPESVASAWGAWASWAGVLVFGAGVYLHFSAPRNALWWILLVLLVTFAVQQVATGLFGQEISGFFGMLVATPLGYLIQKGFKGPPSMVTFLPSFWLLVPGALGLSSVKRLVSDPAGRASLAGVALALASIALGTLMGASLFKWLSERFGQFRTRAGLTSGAGRSPSTSMDGQ